LLWTRKTKSLQITSQRITREAWWLNREAWWLNREAWWLNREAWWLNREAWWLNREAWWLNLGRRGGSMVVRQTVVLQSRV
jgi:hypothetical protein